MRGGRYCEFSSAGDDACVERGTGGIFERESGGPSTSVDAAAAASLWCSTMAAAALAIRHPTHPYDPSRRRLLFLLAWSLYSRIFPVFPSQSVEVFRLGGRYDP